MYVRESSPASKIQQIPHFRKIQNLLIKKIYHAVISSQPFSEKNPKRLESFLIFFLWLL